MLGGAGNLYRNAVSRFLALKIKFSDSFRPSGLPTLRHLFPGPDEDRMLERLLDRYEWPSELSRKFPVYWFPKDSTPPADPAENNEVTLPPHVAPPREEIDSNRFNELFPSEACTGILGELSVWTSVDDCLAAARFIEGRPAPQRGLSCGRRQGPDVCEGPVASSGTPLNIMDRGS